MRNLKKIVCRASNAKIYCLHNFKTKKNVSNNSYVCKYFVFDVYVDIHLVNLDPRAFP